MSDGISRIVRGGIVARPTEGRRRSVRAAPARQEITPAGKAQATPLEATGICHHRLGQGEDGQGEEDSKRKLLHSDLLCRFILRPEAELPPGIPRTRLSTSLSPEKTPPLHRETGHPFGNKRKAFCRPNKSMF
jgi:hypothetical protein